ncbi:MAG: hypothetical protein Q9227_004848 [Pyrenula ochraceoflavens]
MNAFQEFFGGYPGFEPFQGSTGLDIIVQTVRGRITQSLSKTIALVIHMDAVLTLTPDLITEELADETTRAVLDIFGEPEGMRLSSYRSQQILAPQERARWKPLANDTTTEWTETLIKPNLRQLIARVSSRVFIGPELCKNQDWMDVSDQYAGDAFIAARALRQWAPFLRPLVHWVLPECRQVRATLNEARRIIEPVVEKRRLRNRKAREAGQTTSKIADTIGWLDEAANGRPYDVAVAQLGLSFAAIHTTSELTTGLMNDLCANPEYFEPLRQEIQSVVGSNGWRKSALLEMRLLDSVMKESQRHHFGGIAAMPRVAEKSVQLSDGTTIPKGAQLMVGLERMQDPDIFPDPSEYHGRRFLELRSQPGQENRWQFVTTSPEHLAFGHGKHACPGRFFASNEIKVVMILLLMKYEWKQSDKGKAEDQHIGQDVTTDPNTTVMYRTRREKTEL